MNLPNRRTRNALLAVAALSGSLGFGLAMADVSDVWSAVALLLGVVSTVLAIVETRLLTMIPRMSACACAIIGQGDIRADGSGSEEDPIVISFGKRADDVPASRT